MTQNSTNSDGASSAPQAPHSTLVAPFQALRPAPDYTEQVAAPPYDVLNSAEARRFAAGNPWSFLHVSKAEIDLAENTDPHDAAVYRKAAENLAHMIEEGVLRRDQRAAYYIYRLTMGDHQQTGIAAAGSVEAYLANRIRRHEFTQPAKEDDRVHQIEAVNGHTGPVFVIHKDHAGLDGVMKQTCLGKPELYVGALGGVRHEVWAVTDAPTIAQITEAFESMPAIYIADGHHRSAAAARVAAQRQRANPAHTGRESYNRFLIVSFPQSEVQVLDYNRLVKDLNGLTTTAFLDRVKQHFTVSTVSQAAKPEKSRTFGMYLDGQWYALSLKQPPAPDADPIARLDIRLLADRLLEPVLGIGDPRTDPRIEFVGGIRGMKELERRVDTGGMAVAFALYRTGLDELFEVADAEGVMPPKSTWFEPKLADGLVSLMID